MRSSRLSSPKLYCVWKSYSFSGVLPLVAGISDDGFSQFILCSRMIQRALLKDPRSSAGDIMKLGKGFQCHGFLCFLPPIPGYYY